MGSADEQNPTSKITPDDMAAIIARHLAELEEEQKAEREIVSIVKDGRAQIDSFEQANIVAKVILDAQEDLDRAKGIAKKRIAQAEGRLSRLRYVFEGALKLWTQQQLRGKKKRSLILDNAICAMRKVPSRIVTESEEALKVWAERFLVDAIRYEPKLLMHMVEEWERKHGEPAPGRREEPEGESFRVKGPSKDSDEGE